MTEYRWKAVVEYRTENGVVDVDHLIEEISELDDIIERGPDWRTMVRCTITYERDPSELTVEKASKL